MASGRFENRSQALEQPARFVNLHLWHRPLAHKIAGNLALFAEQANMLYLEQTYRQRVILLKETEQAQQLQVQYLGFKQPEKYRGGGANPQKLRQISLADLEWLPGCMLTVTHQDGVEDMMDISPQSIVANEEEQLGYLLLQQGWLLQIGSDLATKLLRFTI